MNSITPVLLGVPVLGFLLQTLVDDVLGILLRERKSARRCRVSLSSTRLDASFFAGARGQLMIQTSERKDEVDIHLWIRPDLEPAAAEMALAAETPDGGREVLSVLLLLGVVANSRSDMG